MADNRNIVLSAKDIEVKFRVRDNYLTAIRGVSLDLYEGETFAIVGESGSGKSVFTKTFTGMLESNGSITNGSVMFEGKDLTKLKTDKDWEGIRGAKISTIFQDPMTSLNPIRTIGSQITEVIEKHQGISRGDAKKQAIELMERVGIQNAADRFDEYPFQYSGGMRQRIVIAIALSCHPKILICDEPTTALDVTVQKQVIKLLNDLQAKLGFAMIFVSHDLALVAEVAHNITVMYAGQVIEQAPTKELLTNPIHEYTRGLLGSVLSIESGSGRLHQVPGAVPSPRDFPKGDRFAPRSSHPRIGLDTRPVFKRVPGTEHFYSELPDEVLKANGLTPHAEVM